MLSNPLLDDLQAELTAHLIATGNLKKKETPPVFIAQWASLGYIAIEELHSCKCGSGWVSLRGLFHREKALTGQIRDTRLSAAAQIPLGQNFPIETVEISEKICPDCLPAHGFRR